MGMHKNGFFHRDMKPENLLYSGETVKLADFGLAREIRSQPPFTDYVSTRWYRAPEVLLRNPTYNSPVDVFACGAIMAELYTLRPLLPGSSESDQLYKSCSVLGTPTQSTWPEGLKLAAKIGFRWPQFGPTRLETLITSANAEAISLMNTMLAWDPCNRISCAHMLQHPYFAAGSLPEGQKNQISQPPQLPRMMKQNQQPMASQPSSLPLISKPVGSQPSTRGGGKDGGEPGNAKRPSLGSTAEWEGLSRHNLPALQQ